MSEEIRGSRFLRAIGKAGLAGLVLLSVLAPAPMAGMQDAAKPPAIEPDQASYLPGETVVLNGRNWLPGEAVVINVCADSGADGGTIETVADGDGNFSVILALPEEGAARAMRIAPDPDERSGRGGAEPFMATATGSFSRATAQGRFTEGLELTDGERLLEQESYWNDRRTYPTGRFNPEWVRQAAAQDAKIERRNPTGDASAKTKSDKLKASPLALTNTGFVNLGPTPERMTGCSGCFDYTTTSGRVNSIVIDPTTTSNGSIVAYAATVGGGVWKTTNCCSAATTWTVKTDDASVSTTSVDSLALDPNNHNVIYAGTGDLNYGSFSMGSQGILKSTDGGNTWTVLGASVFGAALPEPAGNFPQYQAVGKVRVDPNDSTKVLAGTKTGVYISYDSGVNWTGPCTTNAFSTMRQDITGLELTNMGGGVTRILAAVGVRGFATTVQFNLGQNGANGIYRGTVPASGCPSDFTSIASNANGFVYSPVATSSYPALANMNAGSGAAYVNSTTGDQLGRIDIGVAPSNPNVIYAQVQSITPNNNSGGSSGGCSSANGCQLGAWSSNDGGATWTFMTNSAGNQLLTCNGIGSSGAGDYPQNWYDQGVAVDPNNPDRVFFDTYEVWLASRTGTAWYNTTCGYAGNNPHPVHVDQHALAFVPGSSSILLAGNDGGVHGTINANAATLNTTRPTWFNMDTGFSTIEFYSGDISGNFATSPNPQVNGGAQDNGPSSALFAGFPTGPAQWQMGLGGDGFFGRIDPVGTGPTPATGTITLTTGGAVAGETFTIGSQVFTFQATRTVAGTVALNSSTTTEGNNIVTAINTDIPGTATAARNAATVVVTATTQGAGGNSIVFTESATNFAMDGSGTLGGTLQGGLPGSLRFFQGNNSGGLSRCIGINAAGTQAPCTNGGATWTSKRGAWTGDTQSFILPYEIFHGDPGNPSNDCGAAATGTGCGHLIAGTVRVWETITGAAAGNGGTVTWYVNSPANLTKGTLGNRSFINQLAFEPKMQSIAAVGTNDANVQIGRNMGGGSNTSIWTDVTGGNTVLPNRPVLDVAFDPTTTNAPTLYAAVGGFNANTPTTPGHIFRVVCTVDCASFTWTDVSGNLPDIPADSVIANPNFPQQVFAGTDFGLYYTDNVNVASPIWYRFNDGLPNTMIWDMSIDRGATTLSLWTRGRGAFVWPLTSNHIHNDPPVALCHDVTVEAGADCTASASIDNGTYDPEGDSFTLEQIPPGPYSIGDTLVTLKATDSYGASDTCQATVTVKGTTYSPANVWIGLKNSDDVGTNFDLLAEVLKNGSVIGSGEVDNVSGGGSGFNNAVQRAITLAALSLNGVCTGDTIGIRLSVRIGATGHRNGTARLWYNDAQANSRFGLTVAGTPTTLYLRTGSALAITAGSGPRATVDVTVDRLVNGNAWKPFGTWSKTF